MLLNKIISGGQTGADIAGLIAAKKHNIMTGGTAPKNFKTEFGNNQDLDKVYNLIDQGTYKSRTIQNVKDSDGTIAFIVHKGSGGTSKTIGYCKYGKWVNYNESSNSDCFRPVLVIDQKDMDIINFQNTKNKIINWLIDKKIKILNVAGHRKSTAFAKPFFTSELFDYEKRVVDILSLVFEDIKKIEI